MSNLNQQTINEFFQISLEQHLVTQFIQIKHGVEQAFNNEQHLSFHFFIIIREKRSIVQDFINDFVIFSKHIIGKNSKNSHIIIAEIIEKTLILDLELLKKKVEIPKTATNRPYKIMILQFDKLNIHILQLFTRLQCIKLMYEHLSIAEKTNKRFNYKLKFDSDITRHLDYIKVYLKMKYSQAEGDKFLIQIFQILLQKCNSIEFCKFLNSFCNKNELNLEIKKYLCDEFQSLNKRYSQKYINGINEQSIQPKNQNMHQSLSQDIKCLQNSNSNQNTPKQSYLEISSDENLSNNSQDENQKYHHLPQRKQFNQIFIGNNSSSFQELQKFDEQQKYQYIQEDLMLDVQQQDIQLVNSVIVVDEDEKENNYENVQSKNVYTNQQIQQNNIENTCLVINSKEFKSHNIQRNEKYCNSSLQNKQNIYNNEQVISQNKNIIETKNLINPQQNIVKTNKKITQLNDEQIIDIMNENNKKIQNFSFEENNDIVSSSVKDKLKDNVNEPKNTPKKHCISNTNQTKEMPQQFSQTTTNSSNKKTISSNNKSQNTKQISSSRTMYSIQPKKMVKSPKTLIKKQNSQKDQIVRLQGNQNLFGFQNGINKNLFVDHQKAKKLKDKNQLKNIESNKKLQSNEKQSNKIETDLADQSSQEKSSEDQEDIDQTYQEDENSLHMMYLWGHN